jgi:hypothetical protein
LGILESALPIIHNAIETVSRTWDLATETLQTPSIFLLLTQKLQREQVCSFLRC